MAVHHLQPTVNNQPAALAGTRNVHELGEAL